jgi:CRISPR-associated protein Csa3
MRLAVTVGFESRLVLRAVTRLGASRGVVFIRGVTGREGDAESEATVRDLIKALGAGEEVAVDLRDLVGAFERLAGVDFDVMALAGGPRALVLVAFLAAMQRGARVYVVPEYGSEPVEVTGFTRLPQLLKLSNPRLRVLAALSAARGYREVASEAGVDSTTALRHLERLAEVGLVERRGSRNATYSADPDVARLAGVLLKLRGAV